MHPSVRRLEPWPRPLALLLVLAITTGWTPAPQARDWSSHAASTHRDATAAEATVPDARLALAADAARERRERLAAREDAAWQNIAPGARSNARPIDRSNQRPPALATRTSTRTQTGFEVRSTALAFTGRNHMWIPALGMSYRVDLFACSRTRRPDNLMYRWGCAGTNNVYLLGHAASVMAPLHEAYVDGRLAKGLVAIYADGNGRVRSYRVTEWRVVDPVDSEWAIASQPVPSMTLQTCLGKRNQWRLNVRLVATD